MSAKWLLVLALLTASSACAAVTLPDACGKDDVKFDVKAEKKQPAPAPAGRDKAQIVFLETLHKASNVLVKPTIRFGLDGAWVGAAKADSYFAVSVSPGLHHLCAAWQSHFSSYSKDLGLTPLTAEPGKTYFIEYKVTLIPTDSGARAVTNFAPINQDEGAFYLKTYPLATWTRTP